MTAMVSSIDASSSNSNTAALQTQMQQVKAEFDKLKESLESGDLSGAQQAYAALQQNASQGGNNPLQSKFDALGQALQSGDLAAAQQAFSALQAAAPQPQQQGGAGGGAAAGGASSGGGGGSRSSSSKTIVSETSTTSASGQITTVITYSDGSKETSTSYGPPSNSTQSVFA
jgi:hypothetical protein